jgi:hypothetical protein
MSIKTWEDVTPFPSTVEVDTYANTMTVTFDLPLNANELLANLPRPPVVRRPDDRQANVAAI